MATTQSFAGFLIDIGMKATLLLILALISAWLLSRSSSSVRHRLWSLTMLSLVLLPIASCLLPSWAIPVLPALDQVGSAAAPDRTATPSTSRSPRNESVVGSDYAVAASSWRRQTADSSVAEQPPERAQVAEPTLRPHLSPVVTRTSLGASLVTIWCLGAALLASMMGADVARTIRFCRRSTPILDGVWCRLLTELSLRLRLRRAVGVREHAEPIVPLTCGVLRPVVLLPLRAREWDEPMQRTVLMHELAHVKRADVVMQLIGRIACTLYWFHPLAWYGLRELKQQGERACDDAVVTSGEKASDYAEQLLRVATLCCAPHGLSHGVAMGERTNLEVRVQSLFDSARHHGPVRKGVSVAMLLVCGLALGVTAAVDPAVANPQAAQSEVRDSADPAPSIAAHSAPGSNRATGAGQPDDGVTPASDRRTAGSQKPKEDETTIAANHVVWWEKVDGLQAGFLLDSPGLPNQRVPFDSFARYRILVRNTTDDDITFMARPVPFDYRNAPYLIPAADLKKSLQAPEIPREFRATGGRQGWKYDLAYEITLGPGEATIVPAHRGGDDLDLYVGDGNGKGWPTIKRIQAGTNWIVQPLQIWISTEPGYGTGALFEGLYFQTKVDREGKVTRLPATRCEVGKGGTVLYPRIALEVGTLGAAAARNAKHATWGKVDKGLQCGIRLLNPKRTYCLGDTLEAELLWRNRSKAAITSILPYDFDLHPIVHDAEGRSRSIDFGAIIDLLPSRHKFEPGEVRSLGVTKITLVAKGTQSPRSNAEPRHLTVEPGVYKLSGMSCAQDGGNPTSGEVPFQVVLSQPAPPADRKQRQKAAKARIEELGGEVRPYDATTVGVSLWKTKATDKDLEMIKCFNLVALGLQGTKITDAGLAHIQDMKRLGDLDLCDTRISNAGLAHLKNLSALGSLSLIRTDVTDAGMKHLKPLKNLYMLILTETDVTDKGLVHLGDFPKLRTLILAQTSITDNGLIRLRNLRSVNHIRLNQTGISDNGLENLKKMAELRSVELSGTKITGSGLRHLSPSVKSLWLPSTSVDDDGLQHVRHLAKLETLILSHTKISDKGIGHLEDLSSLRTLHLENTKVTAAGIARLKSVLPNCRVSH